MKKQNAKRIIKGVMTFIFILFFLQIILSSQILAANELNWEYPNKMGNNPYKFKPTDILNSQLIMQVVGCSGVVDKVSGAVMNLIKGKATVKIQKTLEEEVILEAAVNACLASKKTAMAGVAPAVNMSWTDFVDETDCEPIQRTKDGKTLDELIALRQDQQTTKIREECFNGKIGRAHV